MTVFVDTHCHLDLFADPSRVLDEAPNTIIVAVTELPSRYRLLQARFRRDRRVRVALGLHPLRAATAGPFEEGQLIRHLKDVEYVGEIGLDFSRQGKDTISAQLRVLDRLLAEPRLRSKVVTVHSRDAEAITIQRFREAGVVAALHWYTGPLRLVDEALAAGLYFSVNPAMLRTKKGLGVIASVPQDRILTESDGPFAKASGHVAGPGDMPWIVGELARNWKTDPTGARRVLYTNLANLYASTAGRVAVRSIPRN